MKMRLSITLSIATLCTNVYSADPQQPPTKKSSPCLILRQVTPPRITITSKVPSDDNLECKKILATFSPEEKNVYNFFRTLEKGADTRKICRYIYKEIFANAVDYVCDQNRTEVEIVIKKNIRLDLNICKQHKYYFAWRNYDSECIILIKFLSYEDTDKKNKSRYPLCTAVLFTITDGSYVFDSEYREIIKYKDEYIYLRNVFSPEIIAETIENCGLELPYEEKTYMDKHNRYHIISNGGTRAYQFSGEQCSSIYERQANNRGSLWF